MKRTSHPALTSGPRAAPTTSLPTFDFHPLTRVVFGPGSLSRLGELVRDLGGRRALLVTDPGLRAAGHPVRALEIIRAAGVECFLFDGVEENPTFDRFSTPFSTPLKDLAVRLQYVDVSTGLQTGYADVRVSPSGEVGLGDRSDLGIRMDGAPARGDGVRSGDGAG